MSTPYTRRGEEKEQETASFTGTAEVLDIAYYASKAKRRQNLMRGIFAISIAILILGFVIGDGTIICFSVIPIVFAAWLLTTESAQRMPDGRFITASGEIHTEDEVFERHGVLKTGPNQLTKDPYQGLKRQLGRELQDLQDAGLEPPDIIIWLDDQLEQLGPDVAQAARSAELSVEHNNELVARVSLFRYIYKKREELALLHEVTDNSKAEQPLLVEERQTQSPVMYKLSHDDVFHHWKSKWIPRQLENSTHPSEFWEAVADEVVVGRMKILAHTPGQNPNAPIGQYALREAFAESFIVERNNVGIQREKDNDLLGAVLIYEVSLADAFHGSHPYDRLRIIYTREKRLVDAIRVCEAYLALPDRERRQNKEHFRHHVEKLRARLQTLGPQDKR